MGGIFNIFSRKVQKSSKEVLAGLEKEIKSKTRSRQRNQQYERNFVSWLLLVSFGVYLIGLAVLYLYFRPSSWAEWLVYLAPLILFPIVVYMIKKLLNLYFSHRKTLFDQELSTLHEEKRKVLNEVMEKETYKTAIELLQRYEPSHPSLQHTPAVQQPLQSRGSGSRGRIEPSRSEARRRVQPTPHPAMLHQAAVTPMPPPMATPTAPPPMRSDLPPPATPAGSAVLPSTPQINSTQPFIPPGMCLGAPPGPPTPCPILPRDRSKVDKVVEYLVGDGPNNRYALICSECHSHNGMALRDEFEYISFRCAYCFQLNPARKKKPTLTTKQSEPTLSGTETPATEQGLESAVADTPQGPEDTPQRKQVRQRRSHRNPDSKDPAGP